jgi:hypothetical protein
LSYYKGSYFRALSTLYPELTFKLEKFEEAKGLFSSLCQMMWMIYIMTLTQFSPAALLAKEQKRREFFDNFAKLQNFHPSDVEKWYSVTLREIHKAVSK